MTRSAAPPVSLRLPVGAALRLFGIGLQLRAVIVGVLCHCLYELRNSTKLLCERRRGLLLFEFAENLSAEEDAEEEEKEEEKQEQKKKQEQKQTQQKKKMKKQKQKQTQKQKQKQKKKKKHTHKQKQKQKQKWKRQ